MMLQQERRKYKRIKIEGPVKILMIDTKEQIEGKIVNISASGIAINCDKKIEMNTKASLAFTIYDGFVFGELVGVVCRVEVDANIIALEFNPVNDADKDKIDTFVRKIYFLKGIQPFRSLTDEELKQIILLSKQENYPEGKLIFTEGFLGNALYIVVSGAIKITKTFRDGRVETLALIREGEIFGEMALIDNAPRSATAVANRPSTLLAVYRDDFIKLMQSDAILTNKVLWVFVKTLSKRLRGTDQRLGDSFFTEVIQVTDTR
ncbi:MAG: cyclic nucleotide-binding domain-containing protein [Candidatus Firestonebacteria bacterium]